MTMKKEKKRFTNDQKLGIIKEAGLHGVRETLEKHGVYPATYYSWKKKYEQMGADGLKHGMTKERLKQIHALEQENELLKQLLAEKELENKLKDELIKKKYPKLKKRYS